jgi:DNA-binding SARP family transcriptional activator
VKPRRPLQIRLLGPLEIRSASGSPVRLRGRKDRALIAYLAARPGARHSRDALASLLWGDTGDVQARASLRHLLFVLRRELREHAAVLALDGSEVFLDPAGVETDLTAFERGATRPAGELGAVAALYSGELLEGFAVAERPFEDWLHAERERVRALALDVLERWLTAALQADQHEAALEAGRRALAIDPVRESVHRALMRVHDRRGERAAVARQYQACVDVLKTDLATTPAPETVALYKQLVGAAGATPAASSPRPAKRPASRTRRAPTPLVGRDVEMARLAAVRDEALAGAGRALVVVGEAGIGKTRLVDELVAPARADRARVIVGHCYPSDSGFALSAWIDALRNVVGDEPLLAGVGAPWRAELGVLVPELGIETVPGTSAGPRRLFEAVGRLVDRLAAEGPLVLVLEDLHWADDATLRLFSFVARRIAALPVLLTATARDEEPEYRERLQAMTTELARLGLLEQQALGPLSRDDAHALARALRRADADADDSSVLETVWRTSEGNPLAVVEAVRAVSDGGARTPGAGPTLPELVRALIRERLGRLPERVLRVLETAAVIGRTFELRLLQGATGLAESAILEQLQELVHRRLLDDRPHGLDFCHERIREVAYAAILPSRRRALHAAVAEAIALVHAGRADEHAHALATHWREAQAWDRAVRFFCRAGEQAARRGAPREALVCYDEAMAALERMPQSGERVALEVDVRLGAGHVLIPLDDVERQARYVTEAEALCERLEDPRRLANVLALRTRHAVTWCDPPVVMVAAERAHALAGRHGDPEQAGDAGFMLCLASYLVGDARRSAAVGRRVIAEGLDETRPGAVFTAPRQIVMRAVMAWALLELGEIEAAAAAADEAAALGSGRRGPYPLIVALVAQGFVSLSRDEAASAEFAFSRAVDLGNEAGYTQFDALARGGAAIARVRHGAVREAVTELEQLGIELAASRKRQQITLPRLWLGEAYLRAGRVADARTQADLVLRMAKERGERLVEGWALVLAGDVAGHAEGARFDAGVAAYREAMAIADEGGLRLMTAHAQRGLARLLDRAGRHDAARGAFARAREMFAALGLPLEELHPLPRG